MDPIRVIIVDDHPLIRQGVRSLLSNYPDLELVGEAESATSAVELAGRLHPDVILMDIRMPGMTGVEATRLLLRHQANTKVLMLTSFDDDEYVTGALQAGARGYILKNASDETLAAAVRAVHRGERLMSATLMERMMAQYAEYSHEQARRESGLTEDECQILRLLADGANNPQIAAQLYLSETTIKRKMQAIFEKLGVATRAQAAAEAVRRGLV